MLSPKQCRLETHELAVKQLEEKEKSMEHKGYTSLVGKVFHEDGTPRRYAGIAYIAKVTNQSKSFRTLVKLQTWLKSSEFSMDFTFPPASSFHVSLADFPGQTEAVPPEDIGGALSLGSENLGLSNRGLLQLELEKNYSITLAYQIIEMGENRLEDLKNLLQELYNKLPDDLSPLELEKPALFRYNNLMSYYPV